MSIARINYVKHARQRYAKVAKLDEAGQPVATPVMGRSGKPKTAKGGREVVRRIRVNDTTKPLPMPKCGHCREEIQVGAPYRWFTVGFRGYPQFRCMKAECTPRTSELESSLLGGVLEAIEAAQVEADTFDVPADKDEAETAAQEVLQQVIDAMDEVIDQYREADEAVGGGSGATQSGERAEALESAKDALESFTLSASGPEGCGDEWKSSSRASEGDQDEPDHDEVTDGCDECQVNVDAFIDEVREEVRDALNEIELP